MSKVAIITCLLGEKYKEKVFYGTLSKRLYANLNGYALILGEEEDYSKINHKDKQCGWLKVYKLLEICDKYDYIFVSDADVCMMNFSIKLEDIAGKHFDDETLMLATRDHNNINSGNILIKGRSGKMKEYILKWIKLLPKTKDFDYVGYQEQPSLIHMILNTDFGKYVKIIEQSIINSYTDDTCHQRSTKYKEGDLLTHYAGFDIYGIPMREKMKEDFTNALVNNGLANASEVTDKGLQSLVKVFS